MQLIRCNYCRLPLKTTDGRSRCCTFCRIHDLPKGKEMRALLCCPDCDLPLALTATPDLLFCAACDLKVAREDAITRAICPTCGSCHKIGRCPPHGIREN